MIKIKKLLSILSILFIVFSAIKPVLAVSGSGTWTGGQYASGFETTDTNNSDGILIRRLINQDTGERRTVFCVEHGVSFITGENYSGNYYTVTDYNMKKVCKVAYLGWYKANGDYVVDGGILDDAWAYETRLSYVFVQQYMWEILGQSSATFVDPAIQERYQNFKYDIDNQIENMNRKPSFNGNTITIRPGDTKTLYDDNGVLAQYNSVDNSLDGVRITHSYGSNEMQISVDENTETKNFYLSDDTTREWGFYKEGTEDLDTNVYFEFEDGVQNQLYALNYNDPVTLNLVVKIEVSGKLEINKSINYRDSVDSTLIKNIDFSNIKFKLFAKEDIANQIDGTIIYKQKEEIGTYSLDENGRLVIEGLPIGTYELQEIQTDKGLVLDTNKIEVKFEKKEDTTKVYDIYKEIKNDTTCVEISKTDITGDKELEGAKLSVLDEQNNVIDSWTSTKKTHKIEGLTANKTYILREEIAPNGYVKATDIKFTIENTNKIQKVTMIDKLVTITKADLTTSEEIEGAELEIIDKEGNVIDKWTSSKEEHIVKNLEEGKSYTLIEKTAPYGYEIAESITFTITDNKETQKIVMKDMPILKNIKVQKIDAETKETIKDNFSFAIYEDIECNKQIKEVNSNKEEGTALFDELRFGTYYIKETKAPTGYEKSDKVVKIEINEKGIFIDNQIKEQNENTAIFDFENKKIEIPKTGDASNLKLAIGVIIISIAGIIYLAIRILQKKNKKIN